LRRLFLTSDGKGGTRKKEKSAQECATEPMIGNSCGLEAEEARLARALRRREKENGKKG